ncbi:MAG: Photosystem I assembly protein Ycf3 [Candidatus Heimdallarchaeota archaeon LC_3]|nr:MAG: Photosystem I assembly protein Ycf3 [Candidatus Heimdallarchaeota archaeon LC_3]
MENENHAKFSNFGDFEKIQTIKRYTLKGNFEDTLRKLAELSNLYQNDDFFKIIVQSTKGKILIQLGQFKEGIKILEESANESESLDNIFLDIFTSLNLVFGMIELNQLAESLELLDNKEKALLNLKNVHPKIQNETLVDFNFLKGKAYRKKGDLDIALDYSKKCFKIDIDEENEYILADPNNLLGIIYLSKGNAELAKKYLIKSLEYYKKLDNELAKTKIQNNLGLVCRELGNFDDAIKYFREGLEIAQKLENKRFIAMFTLNIGLVHIDLFEFDKALNFLNSSLDQYLNLGLDYETALCYNLIGNIFENKADLELALEYNKQSLSIFEKLGISSEIATNLNNIGNIYQSQGNYPKASECYQKAFELLETLGSDIDTSFSLINLIHIGLHENSKEKYLPFLEKLAKLDKGTNQHINHIHRLGKALILKASDKMIERAQAQELFEKLSQEDSIKLQHKIVAMLNICELLMFEAKAMGNDKPLIDVKNIIISLANLADKSDNKQLLIEVLILKSKIELIDNQIDFSIETLEKAEKTATKTGLIRLSQKVKRERKTLDSQIENWHKLSKRSASIFERMEQAKLNDYIKLACQVALSK